MRTLYNNNRILYKVIRFVENSFLVPIYLVWNQHHYSSCTHLGIPHPFSAKTWWKVRTKSRQDTNARIRDRNSKSGLKHVLCKKKLSKNPPNNSNTIHIVQFQHYSGGSTRRKLHEG